MNKQVQAKIQEFVGSLPDYVNGVGHSNDCLRLYNVAVAVWNTGESITDAKAAVQNAIMADNRLSDTQKKTIMDDCNRVLDIIPDFLNHAKDGRLDKFSVEPKK